MGRLTLAAAKTKFADYAPTEKLVSRINEAVSQLLEAANGPLTKQRVAFSVYNGLLTLPRQYSAVVGVAMDDVPVQIKGRWYSYLPGSPGVQDRAYGEVLDLGDGYCTIREFPEEGSAITVKADVSEDADAVITLLGTDSSLEEVRTLQGDDYAYGEQVLIKNSSYASSSTVFTSLTGVIKPVTNGRVRLYITVDGEEELLAVYEANETHPSWRRYRVPLKEDAQGNREEVEVEALCVVRAEEVTEDNQFLAVDNVPAIRDMMRSLDFMAASDWERSEQYRASALRAMNSAFSKANPANQMPAPIQIFGRPVRSFY